MKTLLLGANGQLGRSFIQHGGLAGLGQLVAASRDGRQFDGADIAAIDLAEPARLGHALDRAQPQIIINTAAYTAVDRAESELALALRVNGEAVGVVGDWARRHDALVVHYSTDYVFAGDRPHPYAEDAATAPLGAYGRSKLAGEQALRDSGARHFILRTSWVYSVHGQNFLRTMLRLARERDVLRVVADQHGAPTSTNLIVEATLAALQQWRQGSVSEQAAMQGTYHLVASGETTWHEFARSIFGVAQALGLIARQPEVEAISTAQFPTPARRPAYSVLDNRAFQRQFAFKLPFWRDGLEPVMRQLAINGS
ncbi:dTDP-4-dehydrorhamnose reductase [Dyella soli]|uniref:dTDP-4-dehydrorhamnose reductase n=1 Tax=Dyella soli TaxID=522319 RepID=A0A4R0YQ99_9GAMM|nr:dTDP-4-dehydrorhamnose reductase [Dyella soli]TCI11139.1 dTDP-4-dehydrorhamnose reductase [Dyella soli]